MYTTRISWRAQVLLPPFRYICVIYTDTEKPKRWKSGLPKLVCKWSVVYVPNNIGKLKGSDCGNIHVCIAHFNSWLIFNVVNAGVVMYVKGDTQGRSRELNLEKKLNVSSSTFIIFIMSQWSNTNFIKVKLLFIYVFLSCSVDFISYKYTLLEINP